MSISDNLNDLQSMYCVATTSNRLDLEKNQDCCAVAENTELNLKAVIVADGLGSFEYAEYASKFVTQQAKIYVERLREKKDLDFHQMFKHIHSKLIHYAESFEKEHGITLQRDDSFGTTLIIAIEDINSFQIAYTGNGAIWHIRGSFNHFHKTKYLPWNALNYLNPHSVQNEMGKEALYRLFSLSQNEEECTPTVLQIEKDDLDCGDILMICTDGIYSFDQVPIGKLKDNSVWISGEATMSLFYEMLRDYFEQDQEPTEHTLQKALQTYLDNLREQTMIDDDATCGVLITAKAISYQEGYRKKILQKVDDGKH